MTDQMPRGWLCPRCNKVNAPHINQCDCAPEDASEDRTDWLKHVGSRFQEFHFLMNFKPERDAAEELLEILREPGKNL